MEKAVYMTLLLIIIALSILSTPAYTIDYGVHGTKTVDGDPGDWTGSPPATTPGAVVSNGEFIISDPAGDYLPFWRSDWNWPVRTDVDIVEFRLTGDANNLYLLFRFNTYDNLYSQYIMVVIDVTPDNATDGFASWTPDYGDVELGGFVDGNHVSWTWDYVIGINYDWGEGGYGSIRIWDHNWTWFNSTGQVAFSQENKVIEASIPWTEIGGADLYRNNVIRIWVLVFANSYGGIWDPYDNSATDDYGNPCLVGSDAYDVAGQTPTYNDTSGEFYDDNGNAGDDTYPSQDHWVDTSYTVAFSSLPEPIPEPSKYIVIVTIVAVLVSMALLLKRIK